MQPFATVAPRFRVRELPGRREILAVLSERTDFARWCARVKPRRPVRGLVSCKLPGPLLSDLREAAEEAVRRHGLHGWLTESGRLRAARYVSLSLSQNPELDEEGVVDVHQSTLGTSKTPRGKVSSYGETGSRRKLRHTYFDSYGFRLPTPAARIGALGRFLSECRLSPIRSRLSVFRGGAVDRLANEVWHRDEPVFENLRINIPLRSHRAFRLQIEHEKERPDPRSRTVSEHYLAPGRAYSFDSHRLHRVLQRDRCESDRAHLVLGFAPWFRYDAAADAWEPNEFFGRVHPFDILREGALHPALIAG